MSRLRCACVSVGVIGVLSVVTATAAPPSGSSAKKADTGVAATVGDAVISLQDVDALALKSNMKLAQSLYSARRKVLDKLILEKALASDAAAQGKPIEQVIRERIAALTVPVTEQEVEAYYNANKARMRGRTLEQSAGPIRGRLSTQRRSDAQRKLLKQLKQKTQIDIALSPPRVEIAQKSDDPIKGQTGAKVTIYEFSDFQ
ncbi:MAG: hypothetical protein ACE5E5_02585 [Phycisphaerae bacterium]